MNKKKNKQDSTLGSVDDLFELGASLTQAVKPAACLDTDVDVEPVKTRRRSALIDDGKSNEVKTIGFEQRSARLNNAGETEACLPSSASGEFNKLFAKGVYLLGMREHSTQEMLAKLNAKSESTDVVLAVIDELHENDYLSDERFAQSYVRSRTNRGFGPVKIKTELKSKGISNRLVDDYLDSNSPQWFDVAREQYEKKYSSVNVKDYKEWTKRARFLQGRGFTMEHIQAVQPSSGFY